MKFSRLFIIFAVLAVLVASCKIGKRYTRPDVELPSQLDSTAVADSISIADLPWNEIYADTLLQNLIRKTLKNNKDMLMAAARVKELAAMKRIDVANLFPDVTFRGYGEREKENYDGKLDNDDQYNMEARVTWELDLWGKLRWAKDRSMADFMASVENQHALQMSLVASVAEAYFELVALDNELKIVRQTVDARREGLELARIRYEGGLTSEMTFSQAQVELASAEALIPDLEQQVSLKENEIAFLAGEYPSRIDRVELPEDVMIPVSLPVGLPSALLERRPDVRQAEQELIAANAKVGIAYTSMFPQISLTTDLGAESDLLCDILKSPHYLVSGTLLQPVIGLIKNKARHKAAQAAYERAVYAYEKAVLNAFMDAYNAIVRFNKTKEIYESQYRLERSSRSTLDLAQLQYMNGVIGYLDLLDAQRTYLSAQISLSNAVRDKQLAVVNLYKALGGGWKDAE